MRNWLPVLFLLLGTTGASADYVSALLTDNGKHLVITNSDGSKFSAPMFGDQVGFQQPRVAADGKNVGWLALYPNCCTSYPIPLRLVVLDSARGMHTFEGIKTAIFKWCFVPQSTSVAYMQTVIHGSNFEHYEKRSISNGKLLAEYAYPDDEAGNATARRRAPSWVRCADH